MRRINIFCLLSLSFMCPACDGERQDSPETLAAADELLAELQAQDYRSFERAPGWETPLLPATDTHHGSFLNIYINEVMSAAIKSGSGGPWPEQAIIVKDAFLDAEGTKLKQIAVMKKDEQGWFWGEYGGGDGRAFEAGHHHRECLECHKDTHDHVLAF